MIYTIRRFSKTDNREDASPELIEKAKKSGVVQKVDGEWRIISIKKRKLWSPRYSSKAKGEEALRGFHAQRGFSKKYTPEEKERFLKSGEMEALKWDNTLLSLRKVFPKKSDEEILVWIGKSREKRNKNKKQ